MYEIVHTVLIYRVAPKPDFGGNSEGGGKKLGEVQWSSSRPPWKVRA